MAKCENADCGGHQPEPGEPADRFPADIGGEAAQRDRRP